MDKASTGITITAATTSVTNTKEKSRRISKKVNPIENNEKFNHNDYTRSIHPTTTTITATTTTGPIANGSIQQYNQQRNHCHHPFSQFYSTSHLNNNNNKDKNIDSYDDDDDDDDDNDNDDNDDNVIDNHNNNIDINHHYNMDDNDGDYDDDCDDDYDDDDNNIDRNSNDSIETCSDELPVWAFGEQRWISGVNEDTTCSDLINVLLADEGLIVQTLTAHNHHHQHHNHNNNSHHNNHNQLQQLQQQQQQHQQQIKNLQQKQFFGLPGTFSTLKLHDPNFTGITNPNTTIQSSTTIENNKIFVITERWRRVEQILSNDTKVLQIWSAWGQAKSEVKLTLRQIDSSLSLDTSGYSNNDKDSGMGSPIGSSNSAIMRRRKHRASKSTAAWVTQAQTMHPKSQKTQIEKLMKLILEQGETIQQQLAKLRDRELQIAKIEEERHKNREKEHGKNYLLETYLNGLHEVEEKEVVTGNSDSGIQTEGALSSPEICSSSNQNEDEDYLTTATIQQSTSVLASLPTPKIQKHNPKYYDSNNTNNTTYLATLSTPQIGTKISTTLPINGFRSLGAITTTTTELSSRADALNSFPFKEKPSHREKKLLKEHKQTKEYSSYLKQQHNEVNSKGLSGNAVMTSKTTTITKLKSLGARVVASSSSLLSNALDTHNIVNAQQQNQNEPTKNLPLHLTTSNNITIDDNVIIGGYRISSGTDVASNVNNQNKDIKHLYKDNTNNECIGQDYNTTIDYNVGKDMKKTNGEEEKEENLSEKIQWMEKLVMINKHLQREEELLVRLGAKIRKYESENPLLDENQIREALGKVNNHLETGNMEIEKLELDLLATKEQLEKKSNILQFLNKELLEKQNDESKKLEKLKQTKDTTTNSYQINQNRMINDDNEEKKFKNKKKSETRKVGFSNSIKVVDIPLDDDFSESEFNKNTNSQNCNQEIIETTNEINNNNNNKEQQDQNELVVATEATASAGDVNKIPIDNLSNTINKKDLVENLYNYSQYISKPNYDFNEKNETKNNKLNDEKLLSSVCNDDTNTLPLRSKKTHGILKNKYVPQSTLTDESNSNILSSPLCLNSPPPEPISEIFLTPPQPTSDFIDSSNQFNSNDLLTTVPAIMQTNYQQQPQQAEQQQQQQQNEYQQIALNKFETYDENTSFQLNHAKNLNFTKQTTTEINCQNLNPLNSSLTKIDFIQKQSSLYQIYRPENSLTSQLQSNATTLQPINGSLNSNINLTTTTPTIIERSLLSSVPIEYQSSTTAAGTSIMNLGVSENFLISKKNTTNQPTQNAQKQNLLLHNIVASSSGNSDPLSSSVNIYATDFTGTNPMITTATNTILTNHNNTTIRPRSEFNDVTEFVGTGIMQPRNPITSTTNGIGNGSISYDTINYNNNNIMYNGNNCINEIGIGNRTNIIKTNTNKNKLSSKRFIHKNKIPSSQGIIGNEFESNSDTGLSSLSDDVVHLGTLV